ncbi:hypothetical protein ACNJUT_21205, partial [Mycobacterium tuberculosis]
ALQLPVPLRELPPPPTAQGQSGLATATANPTPAQISQWNYDFTYSARRAAQDSLLATVGFNTSALVGAPTDAPSAALFSALARMIACTPAIFADFNAYLAKVAPDTAITSTTFVNAKAALGAWKTLISDVSTAYADWAKPTKPKANALLAASGPPPVNLKFSVELGKQANGAALVSVVNLAGATSPVPVIEIMPDTYQA